MIIETTPRRAFLRAGLAAAGALLVLGCENELPPGTSRRVITVKELPEKVLGTAKKNLPGVDFQDAWSNHGPDGKLHSYEVRGRTSNGKIREIRVTESGEVLEME